MSQATTQSTSVSVRFPTELLTVIEEYAAAHGMPRSKAIQALTLRGFAWQARQPELAASLPLELAHVNLLHALTALAPPSIDGNADVSEVQARIDHMRAVYDAVNRYAAGIIEDTTDHLPGPFNRSAAENIVGDLGNSDWLDIGEELTGAGCEFGNRAAAG